MEERKYNLNHKEFENVISLTPEKRYIYFIKKVADWEFMYTLVNEDGEYAISIVNNHLLIPFWSFPEYAEYCKINKWENYIIKKISLEYFENKLMDLIIKEKYLVNVFPVLEKTGFIVTLEEFTRDLSEELDKY